MVQGIQEVRNGQDINNFFGEKANVEDGSKEHLGEKEAEIDPEQQKNIKEVEKWRKEQIQKALPQKANEKSAPAGSDDDDQPFDLSVLDLIDDKNEKQVTNSNRLLARSRSSSSSSSHESEKEKYRQYMSWAPSEEDLQAAAKE